MKARRETWPLGCQLMPWFQARGLEWGMTEEGHASLPDILDQVSIAGFTGFEVLAVAVPIDRPDAFVHKMTKLQLNFAGAHIFEPLWQSNGGASIPTAATTACRFKAIGCENLVVSMYPPLPSDGDTGMIRRAARHLCELGRACRDECGLPVVFHNHDQEIADNAACIDEIVQTCEADVMQLAPDLGWVAIGGINPLDFIDRFGERIAYLHARDVTEFGPNGRCLETGQGAVDYVRVADALERQEFEGWFIAESEFDPSWAGDTDPDQSAHLHFEGLTKSLCQTRQ